MKSKVFVPMEVITGDCIDAVKVRGHCMEPTIMDGAVIGVDFNDKEIVVGEIFVFEVRGANPPWQAKRVDRYEPPRKTKSGPLPGYIVLGTDNKKYLNMIHDLRNVEVVGKVRWICNQGYIIDYEIEKCSENLNDGGIE